MASLPPLPNLSSDLRSSHGFSSKAHWVIPGVLMQGERPTPDAVNGIVRNAKCGTFVNLQSECVPEEGSVILDDGGVRDWRHKPAAMAPYGEEVVALLADNASFLYHGIRDMKIAKSLDGLVVAVQVLAEKIRSGEVVYLHCWGGKGRSGLVASCLLIDLYGIDANTALKYVDAFIQLRNADTGDGVRENKRYSSPETYGQILQVKDYQKKVCPEDDLLVKALEYVRVRTCFCVGKGHSSDTKKATLFSLLMANRSSRSLVER